jgi:hypothetical protein
MAESLYESTQILQLKIKDPHSLALMSIGAMDGFVMESSHYLS